MGVRFSKGVENNQLMGIPLQVCGQLVLTITKSPTCPWQGSVKCLIGRRNLIFTSIFRSLGIVWKNESLQNVIITMIIYLYRN